MTCNTVRSLQIASIITVKYALPISYLLFSCSTLWCLGGGRTIVCYELHVCNNYIIHSHYIIMLLYSSREIRLRLILAVSLNVWWAKMSILDLGAVIFQPVAGIVSWMQGKHLLAASMTCSACNIAMTLSNRADVSDGCR